MSDVLTKEQRRKNMQHIKDKDTKIEIILRKALWKKRVSLSEKLFWYSRSSRYCFDKI